MLLRFFALEKGPKNKGSIGLKQRKDSQRQILLLYKRCWALLLNTNCCFLMFESQKVLQNGITETFKENV